MPRARASEAAPSRHNRKAFISSFHIKNYRSYNDLFRVGRRSGTGRLNRPSSSSSTLPQTIRLYRIDIRILIYLKDHGLGYSDEMAEFLERSRRTINKHLRKLQSLNLIERHGNTRCCFQWYSLNSMAPEVVADLIRYYIAQLHVLSSSTREYLKFRVKIGPQEHGRVAVTLYHTWEFRIPPPRQYRGDPGRPHDRSIPYRKRCKYRRRRKRLRQKEFKVTTTYRLHIPVWHESRRRSWSVRPWRCKAPPSKSLYNAKIMLL